MITIGIEKLNALIEREQKIMDSLPPHTMDWYTYSNRVDLLKEVLSLTSPVVEKKAKVKKEQNDESTSK